MKSRRAFLSALLPAGVAAGQEGQNDPPISSPILRHNLHLALSFGEPGIVRAEIQAPGMPLINLWSPKTGLGLGSYRLEIKNSDDGHHFVLLPQPDAVHVQLNKVAPIGEDKKIVIHINLHDGSWLIPKGLPDFLDECDMRLWYRTPTSEISRRLANESKVALDTFVGDWYRLPKWPRLGLVIPKGDKADSASGARRKGMFVKPDDESVVGKLLTVDFETKTELKLVRNSERTSVFLGSEEIFSHQRGSEFADSGYICSKRKSVGLIMLSKTEDGYGAYYHSVILVKLTDKGEWVAETILKKKDIEKLDIISVTEIASLSSSGETAFVRLRRAHNSGERRVGVSTWCVIDVRTGRIIREGFPDEWASQ